MPNPAKPTKLKILQGNPGKRPLNKREPKPPTGIPSCPTWLGKEAKAEWRRITRDLQYGGMITKVDRAVLTNYCILWEMVHRLYKEKPRDESKLRAALAELRHHLSLMGLDPSSRSKMHGPEPAGEVDELRAFLGESG